MAERPYTLADAPSKPSIWLDVQDAATIAYSASTLRVVSVAMKGTSGGSFTPRVAAKSPKYNAAGIDGLPGLDFILSEQGLLNTTVNGPAQPATAIYVWKEAASLPGSGYGVVVDHAKEATGDRYTVFNAYGGPNIGLEGRSSGTTAVVYVAQGSAVNRTNVLIVEYNGASSRSYFNGVLVSRNLRPSLSGAGIAIGGKLGDSFFGGSFGELAIIPGVLGPGDAWDRLTQATMWKWGQQAKIAEGETYRLAAPTVDDGTPVRTTGASSATLLGVVATSAATLAIVAASTFALNVVGSNATSLAPISAQAQRSLGAVGAAGGGQSVATASADSALGQVSTAAASSVPIAGKGSVSFETIASNSDASAAVRGVGASSLGFITSASGANTPLSAWGTSILELIQSDALGAAHTSGIGSVEFGAIISAASAQAAQDFDGQLIGAGWTLSAAPRHFVASATRRSFTVSSTGCKAMLKFPRKYAHEIRHASVDFEPALASGEVLVGVPTVEVLRGDLVIADPRIDGTAVRFTLSGGSASRSFYQSIEVRCPTDGGQVLEEVISVTMAS